MQDNYQELINILTAAAGRQFPIECIAQDAANGALGRSTHFHHCPELRFILQNNAGALIPQRAVIFPSYVLHDRISEEKLRHCASLWLETEAVFCNFQNVTQAVKIDSANMQKLAVELDAFNRYLEFYSNSLSDSALPKLHLNNLLYTICSAVALALEYAGRRAISSNDPVEQVKNIIRLQYSDPELSVGSIAAMLRLNANYLSGIFRRATGETLRGFLIRFRLEQAVAMLQTRRYLIKNVASMCGFRNQYYFANVFRAHYHIPPSRFNDKAD